MGTHPHHPMEVPITRKELRQSLTILTPETTREGTTTFDLRMFISIMIMLIIINIKHGIKKHAPFVDYITIHFLSVGKEWLDTKG